MIVRQAAAFASSFFLYGFCGEGVYTLFLDWFHNPAFAGLAGLIVPFVLLWTLWISWRALPV
jgi:hypothetical protein